MIDFVTFIVAAFATWRITSLFNREDGPFEIFTKFRRLIGIIDYKGRPIATNELAKLFLCPYCLSMWVALPVAIFLYPFPEVLLYWFALSGAAIFIERN